MRNYKAEKITTSIGSLILAVALIFILAGEAHRESVKAARPEHRITETKREL